MRTPANPAHLSPSRTARLQAALDADIAKGVIPGAVTLIARKGELAYLDAFGHSNRAASTPMACDSIFRIASMTKPMVSVAIMMLVEEGRVRLVNPISTYLPEMKNVQVGVEVTDSLGKSHLTLEAPRREPSVQDLLRHTSGVTYGIFGDSLVKAAYRAADVMNPAQSMAQFITKLSQVPLQFHPGEVWDYGMSTDVLGCIVEVVSGMPLDQFIATRITGPLGMQDTGFVIPQAHMHRLAEPIAHGAPGAPPMSRTLDVRPNFLSGGGGMVSTAPDYWRFAQMLLNGGMIPGSDERLLSRKTVALMASDHLPPGVVYASTARAQFEESAPTPEFGQGFGLGFCVRKEAGRNPTPGSVGDFYWSGVFGTYFWVDPAEELIGILMLCAPEVRRHYRALMRTLTYQALKD